MKRVMVWVVLALLPIVLKYVQRRINARLR
jgi:hypothetical protein